MSSEDTPRPDQGATPTVLDGFIECLDVLKPLSPSDRRVIIKSLASLDTWAPDGLLGSGVDWEAKARARGDKVKELRDKAAELQAEVDRLEETLADWCAEHEPDDEDDDEAEDEPTGDDEAPS